MQLGHSVLPFGLDPLIAEAKRRMKRRRAALLVVLVLAAAGTALAIGFSVGGPSASSSSLNRYASASPRGVNIGSGPFGLYGTSFNPNGWKGDLSPFRTKASLACFGGRRFADAFALQNRSRVPVTLLSAHGRHAAAGIVERVATQFALAPPYRPSPGDATGWTPFVPRAWSGAATRPLTIPPGRTATVQANFRFGHCARLRSGRPVSMPGSVAVRYRSAGRIHEKAIPLSNLSFFVVAAPTMRTCAAVPGSLSVVSSDVSCAATRRAAVACHPLSHGSWGDCTSANAFWNCGRFDERRSSYLETCWPSPQNLRAHHFSVRWKS